MAHRYLTKDLVDNGVNFAAIYPQKQIKVKEMLGYSFTMPDIVNFLQKETNNFTTYISLAADIDTQLYNIYSSWFRETTKQDTPQQEPMPIGGEPSEDDTIEAIELMFELLPDDDTQEAIELMIELLDEKKQATMMRKLKKALNN